MNLTIYLIAGSLFMLILILLMLWIIGIRITEAANETNAQLEDNKDFLENLN